MYWPLMERSCLHWWSSWDLEGTCGAGFAVYVLTNTTAAKQHIVNVLAPDGEKLPPLVVKLGLRGDMWGGNCCLCIGKYK